MLVYGTFLRDPESYLGSTGARVKDCLAMLAESVKSAGDSICQIIAFVPAEGNR